MKCDDIFQNKWNNVQLPKTGQFRTIWNIIMAADFISSKKNDQKYLSQVGELFLE